MDYIYLEIYLVYIRSAKFSLYMRKFSSYVQFSGEYDLSKISVIIIAKNSFCIFCTCLVPTK